MNESTGESNDSRALQLVKKMVDTGIDGTGRLISARALAQEYLIDASYDTYDERVDALIRWEASKNFGTGFITGLGGAITLPVALPAALGASLLIQARMCGAIALLYGHDDNMDRVRTLVLLSILGDAGKEAVKEAGVKVGEQISYSAIRRVSGRTLIEINKRVGFRLVTKAGSKGVINLTKVVPIAGGVISGSADALTCRAIGNVAKNSFRPKRPSSAHKFDDEGTCVTCSGHDIHHPLS